ncbi:terpene synthase family protein [Jidongwangia harbinensis]|uniref:terpene synthase family protein n=1 Tax=Jidongwangia harbinensis TaxID=2878561 RepID=UPI001CD973CD|nr:hypothetical protein [Jidongwangia harbinensis]MCA2211698.1 hypothetical protein [Jidongwangia harbinensis]
MTSRSPQSTLDRFPFAVNPHADRARAHLGEWVRRTGLVLRPSALTRFRHADFGGFAAMVHPSADADRLDLVADWFAWLFLVDDQLDDGADGRAPDRLRAVVEQLVGVLDGARPPARSAPVAAALADLWHRTSTGASGRWRRLFAGHLRSCLVTAATWEAGNRRDGVVPGERDYIENRRHTGAIYVCMDLIDIVEDLDVPDAVYDSVWFRAALDAACDVVCWTNDVYSLEKEHALGEFHNLVSVIEHHHRTTPEEAVARVCAAIETRTTEFLSAEAELRDRFARQAHVIDRYTAGMRSWMRGNVDWSSRTPRYRNSGGAPGRPADYLESLLTGRTR